MHLIALIGRKPLKNTGFLYTLRIEGLPDHGGHRVWFPDLRMYPESFKMRHYPFLSVPHAVRKWVNRKYDPAEIKKGWHRLRASLTPEHIELPSYEELRHYSSDDELVASDPLAHHPFVRWAVKQER